MNTQLDTFQAALLTQLRHEVIESPRRTPHSAPASALAGPRRSTVRRLSLAGAASGVAASLAVSLGLVSFGGATLGGATPAFAITTAQDGDVVVTLTGPGPADAQEVEGLEAALRDHGLDADVVYDPDRFPPRGANEEEGEYSMTFGPGAAITWHRTDDGTVMRIGGALDDGIHWTMYLDNQGVTGVIPSPSDIARLTGSN